MSKKTKPIELYLLKGIEDYLTDSAKKYRRNLLFSASIVLAITLLINHEWASGKQITSIFGISLKTPYGAAAGFDPRLLVAILTIIVGWEMMMFWFSKKNCDANWRGRGRTENQTLMTFEPYDIISLEQFNQTCKNLVMEITKLIDMKQVELDYRISSFGSAYGNHLECRAPETYNESSQEYNEDQLHSKINRENFDFVKNYINNERECLAKLRKELKEDVCECLTKIKNENEQWKGSVQVIFQEVEASQAKFSDALKKCSASRLTIFFEFWLPIVVGAIAFTAGMHTSKYLTILLP